METIYDHNLSEEEIYALGHQYRSKEWYLNHCDEETAWTDLALLFRHRHDADNEHVHGAIFRKSATSSCVVLII